MPGDKLTGSDKRALLIWILLGIVGAFYAYRHFYEAQPEASVDFRIPRSEVRTRAEKFLASLSENVAGYESTTIFSVDEHAKTYLERSLGLKQANGVMASEVSVWFWEVRFFKPQQEEEFRVQVSPAGDVVGFEHKIPESQAGASPERALAQATAQDFLSTHLGFDTKDWDFLPEESKLTTKPHRLDWEFTWQKRDFRAKDAPYRLTISLNGAKVGGASEKLHVPETWMRSYKELRSANSLYNLVAMIPFIALLACALWVAIVLTKRGQAQWGAAITISVLVALLLFLMQINQWPIVRSEYDTNSPYSTFALTQIGLAFLFAIANAITLLLVYPAADGFYRATQPQRIRLNKLLTLRGLRSREFFSSAVVGLSLTGVSLGFVVVFYQIASHFGAWAPQDLKYDNSVSTLFPWISGVAIGLFAATNEEFMFRLFAIPFVERITGSRWLAVLIPAFCWSFLHTGYPQEPPYIRGLEVGLVGIAAGIVMLRWGILATLIWHYTFDAMQVGLLLIRSDSLYFKISGVVVGAAAAAPLLFAAISYLKRGSFEADSDLLNSAEATPDLTLTATSPASTAAPIPAETSRYDALSTGTIGFLALCLIAGGAVLWRVKHEAVGDYLRLSVDSRSAKQNADAILRQRGINPNSYHRVAILADTTDPVVNAALRNHLSVADINTLYATSIPGVLWHVRYFRDRDAEEYAVILRPDGSLHSIHHQIAESASGASLTEDEAVARAQKFLVDSGKIDPSTWHVAESTSKKRPKRIDHVITWENCCTLNPASSKTDQTQADAAHQRVEVTVLGDEVTRYRTYIKIPDEWRRKQEELTTARILFHYRVLYGALLAGIFIAALILYLKRLRSEDAKAVPWRRVARWALAGGIGSVVAFVCGLGLVTFLSRYETEIPLKFWYATLAVSGLFGIVFSFGALALVFGLAWYFARRAFGADRIPGWVGMPAPYYRDALAIALGGSAAILAVDRLIDWVNAHWPAASAIPSSFGENLDALLPAAGILGGSIQHSLIVAGFIALLASFVAAELRLAWLRVLLFVLGTLALLDGNWVNAAGFAREFASAAVFLAFLVFGVRRIMRFNLLGGFLLVACMSLVGGGIELLHQSSAFYRANGYAVLLGLLLLLVWPFSQWRLRAAVRS